MGLKTAQHDVQQPFGGFGESSQIETRMTASNPTDERAENRISQDPQSGGWRSLLSVLSFSTGSFERQKLVTADVALGESPEQGLLRRRLRAVSMVLFLARVSYSTRAVIVESAEINVGTFLVCGCLLAAFFMLKKPRGYTIRVLRGIECVMFLGIAIDFSVSLNLRLVTVLREISFAGAADTAHVIELTAAIKDHIIGAFALMMIYGMFIPNTGRRAAAMVLLIGLLPGAAVLINRYSREGLDTFRTEHHEAVEKLRSTNLLSLVIGAGCAIYGTIVVNQLRRRAISAEELGQYRLRQRIGSGGMGDVYLAEHKLLRRRCAVKLIRSDQAEDPVMLARFEREVRATASLTHWNTIQVFDYGRTDDGRFFYVMEYLNGRNLLELVQQFGPMSPDRTVFILEQVCDALRESAARGLVHRDIKPSNIFLANIGERFDVVKLLDFGLVRPLAAVSESELSEKNQINGSPRFMCPEQAQGEFPDIRGDLYSLGAVAYFLLSGRPPFDSDNPIQLVISHASRIPPGFSEIGVSVPEELATVIMQCLEKLPDDRFSSPEAMLRALQALPEHARWTWAIAEHWWRKCIPECIGHPMDETPPPPSVTVSATSESSSSATDPTLIDFVH